MSGETMRGHILVVDDDRSILELVCTRLTLAGYDAFNARDGQEALGKLQTLRPAAMLLDLSIPRLDGFAVLEQMGKAGAPSAPTLVLTARHSAADVKRAIGLGARDYLSKPFSNNQLLMRVARLMRPPTEAHTLEEVFTAVDELLV